MVKPVKKNAQHYLNSTTGLSSRTFAGLAALASTMLASQQAEAACTPVYTSGSATSVTCNSNNTDVDLTTGDRHILNWSNFNTTSAEAVNFTQTGSHAIVLNRISGAQTTFNGDLTANGQVFLINQNGFVFGNGFTANVGGLLVSTADISDDTAFLNDANHTFNFDSDPGLSTATITLSNTNGTVNADGGYIVAQGRKVSVEGNTRLQSHNGSIAIGAGDTFTVALDPVGDGLLSFEVVDPVMATGAINAIKIASNATLDVTSSVPDPAGQIIITAKALDSVYDNLILIDSNALLDASDVSGSQSGQGGKIRIKGQVDATNPGDSTINESVIRIGAAEIDAHSNNGFGGSIEVEANVTNTNYGDGEPANSKALVKIGGAGTRTQMYADSLITFPFGTNDGYVTISGTSNGGFDHSNDGVLFDGVNMEDVDPDFFLNNPENQGTHNGAHNSIVRPCATVNGNNFGGCNDAPDSPPPDAPPEPQPDEAPEPQPDEAPEPQPDEAPEPQPDEAPEPQPDEAPEPQPDEAPEPAPDEAPEPQPDEAPEPQPDEAPEPAPDEAPEPQPDEAPEPAPDEAPEPQPDEAPEPQPDEAPEPEPDAQPEPEPDSVTPSPEPEPEPEDEVNFLGPLFDILDRPVISLRDEEVLDKDFLYVNQFFTYRGALDLDISGGNVPVNIGDLGSLSPAAGGELGELSPAAGGLPGNVTTCVNSFFSLGWTQAANEPVDCEPQQ